MKAAGALRASPARHGRFDVGDRALILIGALYLFSLVLAPAAAAYTGEIDLELDKSVAPDTVAVGETVIWTVSVTNRGPGDATSVAVGDNLPSGLVYVSHDGDGAFDPAEGVWMIGDVPLDATKTLRIETVAAAVGEIVNEAEVTMADQEDLDSIPGDGQGDDWDDASIQVTPDGSELIDLELTKMANPVAVQVGDQTTWTIELTNQGPTDASGVAVTVASPTGVSYVSHTGDGLFDPVSGTWTVGDLAAGVSATLAILTTVEVVGELTCVAEVTMADQQDVDSIPGDGQGDDWDDASVVVSPRGDLIDLELTKAADPTRVVVGDETTWTVDLTNQGPADASGVAVTVASPTGVSYVSHTGDGLFDSVSGMWTVGDLAAGTSVTLAIVTTVVEEGRWTCEAEVTAADQEDFDSVPGDGEGDDWDDATVATRPGDELIDLELTKAAEPQTLAVGGEATWTVDLTNQGPDDATGVAVTVTAPAGLTYVSHQAVGAFDPGTGVWTVGDLAVGEVVVLQMVTVVDRKGEWICQAEVTAADQMDVDSAPGDGEGDDWDEARVATGTPGDGVIDLELTKTAEPTLLAVGDESVWTIDLTNQGPDGATGVAVTVSSPPAVTYVSHAGVGAFAPATGVWTVGDIGAGETVTLEIATTVDDVGRWTCVAEVTTADQQDADSVPGDGEGDDWDEAGVEVSSVLASAVVGDTVWLDDDADGIQDPGEAGIAGAVVVLTNTDTNATATQTTNANGLYLFSALDAGSYVAAIDMSSVDAKMGLTTPGSFTISLADNDAFLAADFGLAEQLPVTGFDPIPVAVGGLILLLLGAVALELTWPEREGRRLATAALGR